MGFFHGSMGRLARLILLGVVGGLLGIVSIHGQQREEAPPTPPTVRAIEVEYSGPATLAKERILAQMRTAIGQPYSDQIVEQDIRNLYKTGQVLNVRIFAKPQEDGVKVIVAVQTRSILREIVVDGSNKVGAKRIRKEIGLKINQPVNEEALEKSRQKIIDVYRGRGFNDIGVEFRVDPIDPQRGTARVVFTVNEGTKGAVRRIHFEGNDHFGEKALRKQMKTRGKTLIAFLDKSGRLDEVQLQQDLDSLREWYQNHGYIDVEVKDVRKERQSGPITIVIAIKEGTQYHVGKIAISGEKATSEQKIRALLKMKEGTVYSPKALREDAKGVADAYGSGGYVDLVVVPQGAPAGPARIDVNYKIEEGDRSFVQRINITGNTRTKDKVIRREVLVSPGDVFNTVRVDRSKKRLENLGYFSKVETYPEDTGIAGRKDLSLLVEEKRTGALSFGGGFSTVDKLVVFAELTQGNFDIMNWPGFTGAGQKFRMRVQLGTQRKDFLISLTEPWFLDRRLSLGGQTFYTEANYLSSLYDQRNFGFSVELRKPLSPFIYASLGYRLEDVDIFNVAASSSPQIQAQAGSRLKSQIFSSLVFDRRDNPILTRRGQRIAFSPYFSGGPLGGDTQIYGWDLEASQYYHLPWDLILLINGEAATVDYWGTGPDPVLIPGTTLTTSAVPIFDRLFLGGSNNLRGFDFRAVGPKDANGEPLGAKSLIRSTVEITFPIVEKARGAFFYDVGVANLDSYDFGTHTIVIPRTTHAGLPKAPIVYDNLASDVGFGLRLDLPIGPLRLDYGLPIDRDGNPGHGKFNFNVGYQF
ncbi:MAG: outer membrane protein assembly factor BamA [Verrucomicrobiota bacterium]